MKRSKTPTFVLTLPLSVTANDRRSLLAIMEAGRRLYNSVLGEAINRMDGMKSDPDWNAARKIKDKKERSAAFIAVINRHSFTPASLITFSRERKNEAGWSDRLGTNIAQQIAQRAFNAVSEHSFGIRGRPRFKGQKRPLHSIQGNDNKQNIYFKKDIGCVRIGKLSLQVSMPKNNKYVDKALESNTKFCRVLWRNEKGKKNWYVQLMQEGYPPIKKNFSTINGSVIGLDIGPSTIAIVSDINCALVKFCSSINEPWKEKRRIQRKMDRSRRATNPHCFTKNGTWKKGAKFTPSKRYQKIKLQYAEIERKLAAERKISHGKLSTEVVKIGNVIQSETLSYKSFQKNYGKSVKVRSPGMFVQLLKRKAERAGGKLIDLNTRKLKMSQYDHTTQEYTKKPLSQRWHFLGDGSGVVQRDVYSAFLARCVIDDSHHPSHVDSMWVAQKPVLLRSGWMRKEPAKIEPSGEITVVIPSEWVDRISWLESDVGYSHDDSIIMEPQGFKTVNPLPLGMGVV